MCDQIKCPVCDGVKGGACNLCRGLGVVGEKEVLWLYNKLNELEASIRERNHKEEEREERLWG